jgi:hypothetical protein
MTNIIRQKFRIILWSKKGTHKITEEEVNILEYWSSYPQQTYEFIKDNASYIGNFAGIHISADQITIDYKLKYRPKPIK